MDDDTGDAPTGEVVLDVPVADDLEPGGFRWPAFVFGRWRRDRAGADALWVAGGT